MNLGQEAYVGLDTHRNTIHATVLDKNGQLIGSGEFPNTPEALLEFFEPLRTWNTFVALEACNFWRGCYKTLKAQGYHVKLANPVSCHKIANDKKTDKVDSKILADLLRVNYLPEVYIPSDEILSLRDLARNKCSLTRMKVVVQNKIKACLSRNGISYEDDLWNKEGMRWIQNLSNEEVATYVKVYETVKKEADTVKKKIEKIANTKEETLLLQTIPGIGDFGAMLMLAEIGDINRFPTPKHLHAYAGVAPGMYQSGTKTRMPSRKSVNYWLKWIATQCAGRVSLKKSTSSKLRRYYFSIRNKKGWKTARKATARKLLTIVWHVLKNKNPYHES